MKTLEEYRDKLIEISGFASNHGINSIENKVDISLPPEKWGTENLDLFFEKCNEGFKIAQKLIVEELKYYQTLYREETHNLKEFRRQRNKISEKETVNRLKAIELRNSTLTHIADSIAWQIIGGQIHIARRLFYKKEKIKFLDSNNLDHAIKIADEINENPKDFALISDITNFVQIGDLLVVRDKKISLIELKDGKINDQIIDFLHNFKEEDPPRFKSEMFNEFDPTTIKQMDRMLRQMKRGLEVSNIIRTDKGVDPRSGIDLFVNDPAIPTECYFEELQSMYEELNSKNWSYKVIDGCIHIGLYKESSIIMAGFIIEQLLKNETTNYIITDWISITQNISEPIFAKPLKSEFIIDFLTHKIKVIIGINLDRLIELFNYYGINTNWMSQKETMKINQDFKNAGLVIKNNRGVKMTINKEIIIYLGGGLISKMLYDNIRPSNIALTLVATSLVGIKNI